MIAPLARRQLEREGFVTGAGTDQLLPEERARDTHPGGQVGFQARGISAWEGHAYLSQPVAGADPDRSSAASPATAAGPRRGRQHWRRLRIPQRRLRGPRPRVSRHPRAGPPMTSDASNGLTPASNASMAASMASSEPPTMMVRSSSGKMAMLSSGMSMPLNHSVVTSRSCDRTIADPWSRVAYARSSSSSMNGARSRSSRKCRTATGAPAPEKSAFQSRSRRVPAPACRVIAERTRSE